MFQSKNSMENIIKRLLSPDSQTIEKATLELNLELDQDDALIELCDLTANSTDPGVRQYAAMLLQKRIVRTQVYQTLAADQTAYLKKILWETLLKEESTKMRNICAAAVGGIIHQEGLAQGNWPSEVLQQLMTGIASADKHISVNSAKILALLCDNAGEALVAFLPQICEMLVTALNMQQTDEAHCIAVCTQLIKGITFIVPFTVNNLQAEEMLMRVLPNVLQLLPRFASNELSDKDFFDAFDFVENLAEYAPKLLNHNLKDLVQFCIFVGSNAEVLYEKRVRVVSFLGCMAQLKKKLLVKLGLVVPMTQALFQLMKSPVPADSKVDDFFDEDEEDTKTMLSVTGQTLDLMALHIPEENLFPPLLELLEPALQSEQVADKRAAYLTMAVVAEGCSTMIGNKYLETMVFIIKAGITHSNLLVRNAAFYCLAQYAEHLQPAIAKYANEILPVLFEFLQQICNDDKYKVPTNGKASQYFDLKQEERMFFALEIFCENLEAEQLQPFLPVLMERLLAVVHPSYIVSLRELAMNAIAAVVKSAKKTFMPYFNASIELLRPYFVKSEENDIVELRQHAIDCLAEIALNVGKVNFMPIAKDTLDFALELLKDADDPDDKRAIYGLLTNLSEIFAEEMEVVFPQVINTLYDSVVTSNELVVKNDTSKPINSEEDIEIDITASDSEDDDEDAVFDIEDAYIREKEEAIITLGSFARHCGESFASYLEGSYKAVYSMLDHPAEGVRDSAAGALTLIVISMVNLNVMDKNYEMLTYVIEKFERLLRAELKLEVALHMVDNFAELLKCLKEIIGNNEKYLKLIINLTNDILLRKLKCQFHETIVESEDGGETEDSTFEFTLVESAGDLLPAIGYAMGPDRFYPVFESFLPLLLDKLKKNKVSNEDDGLIRFFVFGIFAECFKPLQQYSANYFDMLFPLMVRHIKDKSARVRQNTIYGLGELVFYSAEKSYTSFPRILTELSEALGSESKPACLDNICGTICRLILTNSSLMPLPQVLPVLFQHLPLREDFAENSVVIKAFQHILAREADTLLVYFEQVVVIGMRILALEQYENNEETKQNTLRLLYDLRTNATEQFNAVAAQHPVEAVVLKKLWEM